MNERLLPPGSLLAVPADASVPIWTRSAARRALSGAMLAGALLAACGGGGGVSTSSTAPTGTVVDHPDPSIGSARFVVEANQGGTASSLRITGLFWGRLAKIRDVTGTLQHSDFVVGEDIRTDNVDFRLEVNPITEETTVTILHPYTPSAIVGGVETSPYQRAFRRLDQNLIPIQDRSLEPDEIGPFTLVPRNAAIVVRFNDLVDPETVNSSSLKILTGNPPTVPFEARLLLDINHGDLIAGGTEFRSTRALVDTTISPIEAAGSTTTLTINSLGLPPSSTTTQPNVALRFATQQAGITSLIRNLSGHRLSFTGNGSNDPDSATADIVRASRSGGPTEVTGDLNNGFLRDEFPPRVVGAQAVAISTPVAEGFGVFRSAVTFATTSCASQLRVGDVIQQPGVFAEVVENTAAPIGATLSQVRFRIAFPVGGQLIFGPGQVTAVYDPTVHTGKEACFVRFPSVATAPATDVAADSPVIVRFSEPMDPLRLAPFDTFTLTRISGAPTAFDFVIGQITPSSDLKEFRFTPTLPYRHTSGTSETYFLNLSSGPTGPVDLAGNALAVPLPQVPFTIAASEATQNTGGLALRFGSTDEIGNDGLREIRGNFLYDQARGVIRPRSVAHYSAIADRTQPVPSRMPAFAPGVQTPLSGFGSKLQTLWRYCDVGFALLDEANYDISIAGLSWAPVGGAVVADTYDLFEMVLSHAKNLPDETVNAALLPSFPNSGVGTTYVANYLDQTEDPPRVVHSRERGYIVNPADVFVSDTGTRMMPYPWNRGLPVNQRTYWEWRDTTVLKRAAPFDSPGAELPIVINTLGLTTTPGTPYGQNNVPTVGLPMLMEFRCYPDNGALGLNSFDINIANANSAKPNFRAFSTGGIASGGTVVLRDPDLQPTALGGFNPTSTPPGQATLGADNSFYLGQADVVVRISRAHTIWFQTGALGTFPTYSTPAIEPRGVDQPLGTSITLAFRGATNVTGALLTNADALSAYGDPNPLVTPVPPGPTFQNNDATWKSSITQINNARFFQVRVTFLANPLSLLTPELSALGIAWRS